MRLATCLAQCWRKRLAQRWRKRLTRIMDPVTPPPGWEVLPEDWVASGNAFRRTLGYPPYDGPPRYPTIEELEEWERAFPGFVETFRRCAKIESEIRFLRSLRERLPG